MKVIVLEYIIYDYKPVLMSFQKLCGKSEGGHTRDYRNLDNNEFMMNFGGIFVLTEPNQYLGQKPLPLRKFLTNSIQHSES